MLAQQYTCGVLLLFISTTRYLRCRQRPRRGCSGEDRADAHDVGNGFGCACRLVECWIWRLRHRQGVARFFGGMFIIIVVALGLGVGQCVGN